MILTVHVYNNPFKYKTIKNNSIYIKNVGSKVGKYFKSFVLSWYFIIFR